MTLLLVCTLVGFLGLVMGSFAGAQVWRLRAHQLADDKKAGEPYDKVEYARLKGLMGQKQSEDRSRCLSCGHTLAWYDLLPLVSWAVSKGKCRYCKQPIGRFEPLMELGTATAFILFTYSWVASFGLAPIGLCILALWLAALTMFAILFAYDLKWFLLPDAVMFPLIGLSILITVVTLVATFDVGLASITSVLASVAILSGLYLLLWLVSKGAWVGFGDVKLGVALGVLLIDWKLALLALFLANLIGTLVVLPGLISGKMSRKTQVPFGPFLIIGFFIALIMGDAILSGYQTFNEWLSTVLLML